MELRSSLCGMGLRKGAGSFWGRLLRGPIAVLALWVLAYAHFTDQPHTKPASSFRVDYGEAVAYPTSDAGCHYHNALAIMTGEGLVNWRVTNRWSVYKPAWGVVLAAITEACDRDLEATQRVVTMINSAAIPAFYLLILALFPGRWTPIVAGLAAVYYLYYPNVSWWFPRTMMTEGPSLLLSLVVCALAVGWGRQRQWPWWRGFILGAVSAMACLVRGQARYAVAAMLIVLAVAALRRPRARAAFLAFFLAGFACVAGPLFLKTSYHLGRVYTGTSYLALNAVLGWSSVGKAVGGSLRPYESRISEAEKIEVLKERAKKALWRNLQRPKTVAQQAYKFFAYSQYLSVGKRFGWEGIYFLYLLTAAGIALSILRSGLVSLVPLAWMMGFVAPHVLFSYYISMAESRFAAPIAWVGLVYVSGLVALALHPSEARRVWRRARGVWRRTRVSARDLRARIKGQLRQIVERRGRWQRDKLSESRPRRPWLIITAMVAWIAGTTGFLLWLDLRPAPRFKTGTLLLDPRTRSVMESAGITLDAELHARIKAALAHGFNSSRVHIGVAHLPFYMEPTGVETDLGWVRVRPADEGYTSFYAISPWKYGDTFRVYHYTLPGRLYEGFRHGDMVLILLASEDEERPQRWADFPTFHTRAVIPVAWTEEIAR